MTPQVRKVILRSTGGDTDEGIAVGELLHRRDIEVTVDHAAADWHGNVGVVPTLIPHLAFDPHEAVALVCGPEVMMRFTANALLHAGVPAERIYLSMERNMKCAIGLCGHCQFGPDFICKDGPVMPFERIRKILSIREI